MRPARAGDLPAVLAFWASAAEDAHRPVDTEAALTSLPARDPHALILAEAGPALVGTIVAGRMVALGQAAHPRTAEPGQAGSPP
jgi:hypothetical protein